MALLYNHPLFLRHSCFQVIISSPVVLQQVRTTWKEGTRRGMIIALHGKTGGGIKGRPNHLLKYLCWWMRGMEVNLTDTGMLKHPVCHLLLFFEGSPMVEYLSRIFMCKHSLLLSKSCFLSFQHYYLTLNFILPKLSLLPVSACRL